MKIPWLKSKSLNRRRTPTSIRLSLRLVKIRMRTSFDVYNLFLACIQTRIYLRGISTSRPFRRNNASTMTDLVATPRDSRPPLASVRGHTQSAVQHGKAVAHVWMRLEHMVTRVTTFWTPCSSLEAIPITRPAQNWCGRSLAHFHQALLHW